MSLASWYLHAPLRNVELSKAEEMASVLVASALLAGSLVGDDVMDAVTSAESDFDSSPSPFLPLGLGASVCSGGGLDRASVAGAPPSCLLKTSKLWAVAS